eukprot:COSAG04_NODE_451_length_14146_cov_611.491920_23_plen_169_part_00
MAWVISLMKKKKKAITIPWEAKVKKHPRKSAFSGGGQRAAAGRRKLAGTPECLPRAPRAIKLTNKQQTFRRMFHTGSGGREKSSRSAGFMAIAIFSEQSTRNPRRDRKASLPPSGQVIEDCGHRKTSRRCLLSLASIRCDASIESVHSKRYSCFRQSPTVAVQGCRLG